MSTWGKTILTKQGESLINQCLGMGSYYNLEKSNDPDSSTKGIVITRVSTGRYRYTNTSIDYLKSCTDLATSDGASGGTSGFVENLAITDLKPITSSDSNNYGQALIQAQLDNQREGRNINEEYPLAQIGVFARLEDSTEEVLFTIIQYAGDTLPVIPSPVTPTLLNFGFYISIATTDTITIEMEYSGIVTAKQFKDYQNVTSVTLNSLQEHAENEENPHNVTKEQVGLGKVPNVETNNQTPTFTESSTLTTLTSGEKLSTLFGKIKKAITDLISHITNQSNPHNVTKSQVGLENVDNTTDVDKPISKATQDALDGKAPVSHSSSDKTYGVGSGGNYGHLKLSSSTGSDSSTTDGVAATPYAVKKAYDLANDAVDHSVDAYALAETKLDKDFTSNGYTGIDEVTERLNGIEEGAEVNKVTSVAGKTGDVTVTKTDVGLGNVPNVSTNNQTPTFSLPSSRTNVSSGDTLSTLFGKIYRFFTDLKSVAFSGSYNDLSNKPTLATESKDGFMAFDDKTKLDGISFGVCYTGGDTTDKTVTVDDNEFNLHKGSRVMIMFMYAHNSDYLTLNVNGTGASVVYFPTNTGRIYKDDRIKDILNSTGVLLEFVYDGNNWVCQESIKTVDYNDLTNRPSSLKNPNSLTLTMNGSSTSYNGSATASKSWYAPTSVGTAGYNLISNGSGAPVWKMPDNYAECTTSGETTVKSVSIPNFVLTKGVRVRVKFSYPHKSLSNPAQLNVNGSGAKVVKYYGRDVYGYMGKPFTSSAHLNFFANTWETDDIVEFEYDGTYWVSIPSKHIFDPSDIRIAHTDYIQWNTSGETCYMGMYCNHIVSNADYIISNTDSIDVELQDAVNRVIGGGKIQLIGGKAETLFVINTNTVIGRRPGSWTTSALEGVSTFTLEGKSRNGSQDIRPTLRFKSVGCLDGTVGRTTSNGMTLTIKDVILSKSGTEKITLINLGRNNGSTLMLENVSIDINATIPDELFIADNIILKNCDFTIDASLTSVDYPCSSGLWCKNIQISGGSITLVNNVSNEFYLQSYELNFLYNSEAKGRIENCKINCSGNYRTNISNGEIIFDKCDITLNNKAALCHYTTDTERKYSILRDCTINYTATTYLTFGKVTGCTFINSSSGYTTDSYKLQILCPTQMIGNLFVGHSEMNFNNNKVQFIGNAMQYSQSYTSFPTGSVNTGTMITG